MTGNDQQLLNPNGKTSSLYDVQNGCVSISLTITVFFKKAADPHDPACGPISKPLIAFIKSEDIDGADR